MVLGVKRSSLGFLIRVTQKHTFPTLGIHTEEVYRALQKSCVEDILNAGSFLMTDANKKNDKYVLEEGNNVKQQEVDKVQQHHAENHEAGNDIENNRVGKHAEILPLGWSYLISLRG